MAQDLSAVVEDHRRRIEGQTKEVERLQGVARDLEAEAKEASSRKTIRWARRARADLERAQKKLAALKSDYARFRLREALGQDPAHLDAGLFDQELLRFTSGRLTRQSARDPRDGRISFGSFRTLLLADLPLGELIANERAERKAAVALDLFDERTGAKGILRRWAAMLQSDAYLSDALRRASDTTERFTRRLDEFTRGLENLRINYELRQRRVDELAFELEGNQPAIHAVNYWENVERLCTDDARHLLAAFLGLEQARDELRGIRDELNAELRQFMRAFLPRYLRYATRQSRARRQRLGLGRLRARRLCRSLLHEVERTDFLLPGGGGMEIVFPRIPRNIAAFRRTKSFQRYKKSVEHTALPEALTVAGDGG